MRQARLGMAAALVTLALAAPASATPSPIEVTIDRFGGFTDLGHGIARGTATCHGGGEITADIRVGQQQGGSEIEGFGVEVIACDGTEQDWQTVVRSNRVDDDGNFLYRGGPADVFFSAFGCFEDGCHQVTASGRAILRGPPQTVGG